MDFARLLTTWTGRIRRKPFWIGLVIMTPLMFGALFIPIFGGHVAFVLMFPVAFLAIKRLHDLGLSGWWLLVVLAARLPAMYLNLTTVIPEAMDSATSPSLQAGMGEVIAGDGWLIAVNLFASLATFAFYLWLGLARGKDGDNRFGRAPGTGGWKQKLAETQAAEEAAGKAAL